MIRTNIEKSLVRHIYTYSIITTTIQQLHKTFLVNLENKHTNFLVIIDLLLKYNILSRGIRMIKNAKTIFTHKYYL